ncbi:MAG: hypothetical protein NUV47_00370 [Patescibacteria group bacterium]|nr:hypothetical protein [Patescibacteria group bacterium]
MDTLFTETARIVVEQKKEHTRLALEKEKRKVLEKTNRDNVRKLEITKLVKNAQTNLDFMTRSHKSNRKFPDYLTTLFEEFAIVKRWYEYEVVKGKPEPMDEITASVKTKTTEVKAQRLREVWKEELVLSVARIPQKEDYELRNKCITEIVIITRKAGDLKSKVDLEQNQATVTVINRVIPGHQNNENEWKPCILYWGKALDVVLENLTTPDGTIRQLIEKFGLPNEWRDEY